MKKLYETYVVSKGGRKGHVTSDDHNLDIDVSLPKVMGGSGNHPNPEQLFAAGYAACFESAIMFVAKKTNLNLTKTSVTAKVALYEVSPDEGFRLTVELVISIPEVEHQVAQDLANKAHQVCPYSHATRNNIDVKLNVTNSSE